MKILYFVDYYQPQLGYSEFFLPKSWDELGHEVTIVTSNYYYPFPDYESTAGKLLGRREQDSGTFKQGNITVVKERLKAEIFTRAIFGNHKYHIERIKPDLIVVNKSAGFNAIRAAQLKPSYNYHLIAYDAHLPSGYHAVGNVFFKNIIYSLFRFFFASLLNRNVDHFVAVQEGTVEIMRDLYGHDHIIHIPLGTDHLLFRRDKKAGAQIRKELHIPADDTLLIYTGKIIPTKGVDILFEALDILLKKKFNISLLLVGSGTSEYIDHCLGRISREEFKQKIHIIGFKNNQDLYKYYSASDIGVWPLEESTAMNDAASCSIPFIANDQIGVEQRFKNNNALRYKRGSSKDLARQIEFLHNDPKLRVEMGRRGRELIERELSWKSIAKKYLNLIK